MCEASVVVVVVVVVVADMYTCVLLVFCACFGCLVWGHGFRMSDCWLVLWVGCVKVAIKKRWAHPPFETYAWVVCCVLLCFLLVFGLCGWASIA